ncbi:MAG: GAF domain-containing protein [Anaerolineae bacterium]|nr:GAF domain-containing protein [Anaerolineae bacterium]
MLLLPDTPDVRSRLDLLYLVTREFNAGLDIDQVLNRVLAATVASVGAADASLFLFDDNGELENFFLISGFQMQERSRATMEAIHQKGLIAWVKEHRQEAIVKDTATDKRWYKDKNNLELSKVGSAVSVPIQLPDQLLGVITITATEPNYFDESNLAMLSIIADQAAFAIANARLFKAEQHRRRLADTLASIAHTINSTLDLNKVLKLILEQLALVIEYDSCSIFLYDEEGDRLVARAAHGFDKTVLADALGTVLPMTESLPNYRVFKRKKAVVIPDVGAEPGWLKTPSSAKIQSWIGVPLITRNKVLGMLTIDSHQVNKYSEDNIKDVVAFAEQATTAVTNAQVFTLLQNAEASYTALFEDNTDMIIISNYQGVILNVNRKARQMLWRAKEEFLGNQVSLIDPSLKDYLVEKKRRLKAWQEVSFEVEVVNAHQQTIPLEFKARQVHYDGKDCVQWVGRDISTRKEAERLRQDLVKMLVHDLRGPLGNLISTIDLLPRLIGSTTDNPSLDQVLRMARRNSQELKDLIDSMLDVSRHEQGQVPLQRKEVKLEKIIQTVKDQVTPRAATKDMDLIFTPLPDLPPLWVDENMIRRVLVNLIDNAIKYTPNKGQITITATHENKAAHIAISDNGPGIRPEDQGRIFEKFSRVDHSANAPAGVGLGLAFCKLAVDAHGGAISIQSEGVAGKGSTFHVLLPITTNPQ